MHARALVRRLLDLGFSRQSTHHGRCQTGPSLHRNSNSGAYARLGRTVPVVDIGGEAEANIGAQYPHVSDDLSDHRWNGRGFRDLHMFAAKFDGRPLNDGFVGQLRSPPSGVKPALGWASVDAVKPGWQMTPAAKGILLALAISLMLWAALIAAIMVLL